MSMKSSARSSAKSKVRRLTKVATGKVDASGWTQPHEAKTPRARRAYAAGGKVDKYVGEVEKEAGTKIARGDKRPRKMDGGPTTGPSDPRAYANNMMQSSASRAPVGGSSPIPTISSGHKMPFRPFKRGGEVVSKVEVKGNAKPAPKAFAKPEAKADAKAPMSNDRARGTVPAGSDIANVPKRIQMNGTSAIMPNTDGGPALKKGGRACKADGGATYGRATMNPGTKGARRATDDEQKEIVDKDKAADACMDSKNGGDPSDCFKKGGRAKKAEGGKVLNGIAGPISADDDDQFDGRVAAGRALSRTDNRRAAIEEGRTPDTRQKYEPGMKRGGRAERKAGGRVKGKTNINIIIAPSGGGDAAGAPPAMGAPGMPPHPPMMPPPPAPAAGAPPGAPPAAAPPNPLAGLPPQLIAQAMGGGGGQGASMPPSGPPRLPMRAAGGRIMRDGAGGGLGRLEKTKDAAKAGRRGL